MPKIKTDTLCCDFIENCRIVYNNTRQNQTTTDRSPGLDVSIEPGRLGRQTDGRTNIIMSELDTLITLL